MISIRCSAFILMMSGSVVCPAQDPARAKVNAHAEGLITEEKFMQCLVAPLRTEAVARDWLNRELERRIYELEQKYGLSSDQVAKLRLAGTGDIKLFFDKVESKRTEFRSVSSSSTKVIGLIRDFYGTRRSMVTELFGDDSIFHKTLRTSLNKDQFARYYAEARERRRRRYWGLINNYLDKYRTPMALTDAQSAKLMRALLEETESPSIIPAGELEIKYIREAMLVSSNQPTSVRTYDEEVMLLQISKLPEARLKEILLAEQLRKLPAQIERAKKLEPEMRKAGYLR